MELKTKQLNKLYSKFLQHWVMYKNKLRMNQESMQVFNDESFEFEKKIFQEFTIIETELQ